MAVRDDAVCWLQSLVLPPFSFKSLPTSKVYPDAESSDHNKNREGQSNDYFETPIDIITVLRIHVSRLDRLGDV